MSKNTSDTVDKRTEGRWSGKHLNEDLLGISDEKGLVWVVGMWKVGPEHTHTSEYWR